MIRKLPPLFLVLLAICNVASAAPPVVKTRIINFDLPPNSTSAPINLPANTPVNVSGVVYTPNFGGVTQVTIARNTHANPNQLYWVSTESGRDGTTAGTADHIVFIDYANQVDLIATSTLSLAIRNTSPTDRRTGQLTLTYSVKP